MSELVAVQALTSRDDGSAVSILAGDIEIARYVVHPDAPTSEAPKPYLHPIRSLSGAPLSVFRPWDHRWHKGLQMTWSHVSGQNFWGGPTFSVEQDYHWEDNLGSIVHDRFEVRTAQDEGDGVVLEEHLTWLNSTGERWFDESRSQRFHGADPDRGLWVLDFDTVLTNARGADLELGSPTTHGRPAAGYTGYFWRGPRSWTAGTLSAPAGIDPRELMGGVADWVAISGQHDGLDGGGTVMAFAGTSSATPPIRWFVRTEPFAAIAPSPSFDEPIVLRMGESLTLSHRYVFVDRVCEQGELDSLGREFTR